MGSKEKTVIVTGASQGIGAGVVKAFVDRGYNVVANSRSITKSGAFAASTIMAVPRGVRCLNPARARNKPTSECVRLSNLRAYRDGSNSVRRGQPG